MIQTEIDIMRMIEHPNIISLHEVFEDKATKKIFISLWSWLLVVSYLTVL